MEDSYQIIGSDQSLDEYSETLGSAEKREWLISEPQHGKRIDQALSELVPEFSRNYIQQLIESGAVELNHRLVVKPSVKVRAGDVGIIELRPTQQSQSFKPQDIPLEVFFRDEHLLVINKPAGLVVHPAPGNWSGTLLNALLFHDPLAGGLPRAGIVHRLDKDTSGLMLVARTRPMMDALIALIAQRKVSRQYLAIANKAWQGPPSLEIDAPLGRDPRNRLKMAVVDLTRHSGKIARTHVSLIDNGQSSCLLKCTLDTGRTHQIRVHLAHVGHPLVSDDVYGGKPYPLITRQALHAFRLSLVHPVSGVELVIYAPLPEDFKSVLGGMGLIYNEASMEEDSSAGV